MALWKVVRSRTGAGGVCVWIHFWSLVDHAAKKPSQVGGGRRGLRKCRDRRDHEVIIAEKQMRLAVVQRATSGLLSKRERGVGKVLFGVFTFRPGWRVWSTVKGKRHLATTSKAGVRNKHVRVACVIVSQIPSMGQPVFVSPSHGRRRSRNANFFHKINCKVHLSLSGSVVLLHAAHVSSVWRSGAGEKLRM